MPFDGSDQNRVVQAIDRMEAFFEGGRRWIKGQTFDGHGRCLVGAVHLVAPYDTGLRVEICGCLVGAMPQRFSPGFGVSFFSSVLPLYNDSRASYADIESLLHKAREIAKEKVNAV